MKALFYILGIIAALGFGYMVYDNVQTQREKEAKIERERRIADHKASQYFKNCEAFLDYAEERLGERPTPDTDFDKLRKHIELYFRYPERMNDFAITCAFWVYQTEKGYPRDDYPFDVVRMRKSDYERKW